MAETSSFPFPVSVISPQYCTPNFVDLVVARKEKALTEGNFAVTDVNGNIMFEIKGKFLSLHDRRVLRDAAGNPLLSLKEKFSTLHDRWRVFRGDNDESENLIFTVKRSKKNLLDVFLANNTDENVCDFNVNGNWLERSCFISTGYSNTIIAKLDKKNTIMDQVEADAFMVKVYPNVDYAFIVSLIALIDAIFKPSSTGAEVGSAVGTTMFEVGMALGGLPTA